MLGILYFIPGHDRGSVNVADLKPLGLEHAIDGEGIEFIGTSKGPDGSRGMIASAPIPSGTPGLMIGYRADSQIWRKGPGGKYWVGYETGEKPGPDDLKRAKMYDGTLVKLLDGNEWLVPRCHAFLPDRYATLPRILDLAEDAETIISTPDPRYASLCERTFDWWLEWSDQVEEGKATPASHKMQLAVDALAVNYRLGRLETIGLLKLLGTNETSMILRAMIDADEIESRVRADNAGKQNTSPAAA